MNLIHKSWADMANDIRSSLHKIPRDTDLVVGIPKSGMTPASMIALSLHIPSADLEGFVQGHIHTHGLHRGPYRINKIEQVKKVLVVDDWTNHGSGIERAKQKLGNSTVIPRDWEIRYFSVYKHVKTNCLDIWCEEFEHDSVVFEWNMANGWFWGRSCVDIDGVLCPDPTSEQDDDGERYFDFIVNAPLKYKPRCHINTLVTNRLEKYREPTSWWLESRMVDYGRLVMYDCPDAATRRKNAESVGWGGLIKTQTYNNSDCVLFVESNEHEASDIHRLTGKNVLCVTNQMMYHEKPTGNSNT